MWNQQEVIKETSSLVDGYELNPDDLEIDHDIIPEGYNAQKNHNSIQDVFNKNAPGATHDYHKKFVEYTSNDAYHKQAKIDRKRRESFSSYEY